MVPITYTFLYYMEPVLLLVKHKDGGEDTENRYYENPGIIFGGKRVDREEYLFYFYLYILRVPLFLSIFK